MGRHNRPGWRDWLRKPGRSSAVFAAGVVLSAAVTGTALAVDAPQAPQLTPSSPQSPRNVPLRNGVLPVRAVPPAPPGPRTYAISSGDTLWTIAHRECGDGAKWKNLASANHIAGTLHLGQVITVAC